MSEESIDGKSWPASALRTPFFWLSLLNLGLLALAYFELFFPPNYRALSAQSEQFFFEANEAAGAPVLILSGWLFYRRSHLRDLLRGPGAFSAGLFTMLLAAALYGWGAFTTSADLQLTSILLVVLAGILFLGGRAAVRAYWLPIVFLGFALPISPVLLAASIYPAQLVTAQFSGLILNMIGVVSVVQGDQILRPENTFIVIETCSGVRTIVTLSMLTILLIDLFERRGWHAAILICLAPVVAFFVNGLRVVTLVLNPHSSIHSIHNLQGIAMLLVGLVIIYLVDGRLEKMLGHADLDAAAGDYGSIRDRGEMSHNGTVELILVASFLIGMLAFDRYGPTWEIPRGLEEKPVDLLTRVFGEDPGSPYTLDYNFVGSVHYLAQARHRVEIEGEIVEIYLGVGNEQLRRSSILTKRLAWPSSGYEPVDETFVEIEPGGPRVRRMVLRRGRRIVLSYSWIERRGSLIGEWFRQALALDRSPFARKDRMLAIRLSTGPGHGDEHAKDSERRIRSAWTQLAPALEGYARTGLATANGE